MTLAELIADTERALLRDAPSRLTEHGVLVLEIGHERAHFEEPSRT